MKKLWAAVMAMLATLALAGCSTQTIGSGSVSSQSKGSGADLRIVAATELKDLQGLIAQASEDLGFGIELEFPAGTLENSQALKRGEFDGEVDATWFATNRYVNLIGASAKLADETKIATSPVAFGVWDEAARRLGWDTQQPTWTDFAKAAEAGEFTFGMTNPSSSNSGFSALVAVATALADTGEALSPGDLEKVSPTLQQLFQAQAMVSGSSGWLAEAFVADPTRADAIVNYESTLHQLREQGNPIQVVVPADGVISADYPLSTLAEPANPEAAQHVRELADWLMDHQEEIASTFRRPVTQVGNLPSELANQQVIELPFPANQGVVDELLYAYDNSYRAPGSTTFILDTSGSMSGQRIESLRSIMHSLVDGSASTLTGDVSLRDREKVTLWSFDDQPNEPVTSVVDRNNPESLQVLTDYVDGLEASGSTAMYRTLLDALAYADTSAGIPSIVVFSDGEDNVGPPMRDLKYVYAEYPEDKRRIPVFVILYGSANASEMRELAAMTGGKVFDALGGDLEAAFKEIRGYQ
ncbi:substrate-binding domain-containing protein [Corynebacterium sp. TA-R-1]|uniref:Substrate-binding domain-containing protein n=1 Tax=Corynebacterium stercoris TaxID=2943490 RepID=A0ABT1G3D6_9CORY|nr:substrate-binding domain-containing protein [Corynebacterium stercoris]